MSNTHPETRQKLIAAAIEARRFAYAPYSQFNVGAALLCENGDVVTGCNVENAVFGLSLCAERVATCKAISENRGTIVALAIAASPLAPPCGSCRQFLAEFNLQMEVTSIDPETGDQRSWNLSQLLPEAFKLEQ